jgi:two-component system sensor histidine kinase RpfC
VVLPLYAGELIRKLSDARAAAETASQAKSLFLANVSHELRTPLNAIIGMSALLRDSRLDAGQRDMVHTVGVAARSLLELIDDILDLSQIEAGRMAVRIEEFDLPDLLAEVRGLVAAQAQARGIRIGLHLAAGTPARLRADRRHLREILVNLAGNAVKFTELGGVSVAVRAERVAEARLSLRFEVSDTGIGVAPRRSSASSRTSPRPIPASSRASGAPASAWRSAAGWSGCSAAAWGSTARRARAAPSGSPSRPGWPRTPRRDRR